jgi:hypothetical protein
MNSREIWKPVVGYEGRYEVSNFGRVKSLSRPSLTKGGVYQIKKEKILRTTNISLCDGKGNLQRKSAGQMVLEAFEGPCPDGLKVHHLNGSAKDNRWPDNLCYSTQKEISAAMIVRGAYLRGEKNPKSILNDSQARDIKLSKEPTRVLVKRFRVSRKTVYSIQKGQSWRHITKANSL